MLKRPFVLFVLAVAVPIILLLSCQSLPFLPHHPGTPGEVRDEARAAKRAAALFSAADEDYIADMDGGVKLSPEEINGRNTWIVWTGVFSDDRQAELFLSLQARKITVKNTYVGRHD